MQKVLFVCTGNICRSPTAEGVFRHILQEAGLAHKITVDSAGTHGYHIGEAPDSRAIVVAKKQGISIDGLKARKIAPGDFYEFNMILALDFEHLTHLRRMAPKDSVADIALFLEYAGVTKEKEVPDPYYGEIRDFEYALELIEVGSKALLDKLKANLREPYVA